MFRMEKIRGASVYGQYLEEHLDYSDYVGEKEKVVGEWFGKLGEELGLTGHCRGAKDPAFQNLCDGLHPISGEELTQHRREEGVRFFDFQADTPKSVSVLAVTMGDTRIIEAHNLSVRVALVELEKFASYQAGKGSERGAEISGNVVGAAFTHLSARPDAGGGPADPQLHTHCAIANVTKALDGKYYALNEIEMLRAIRYAGKVYENEIATRIEKIGYQVSDKHSEKGIVQGFEISGVPQSIMDRFSKRSQAVEAAVAEFHKANGRNPTTGELRVLKRETRGEKAHELSQDELIKLQKNQLAPDEQAALQDVITGAKKREREIPIAERNRNITDPRLALDEAIAHLYERDSVLPRHQILAEALAQNIGRVVLQDIQGGVQVHPELVPLTASREKLTVKAATVDGLKDELRAVNNARAGEGKYQPYSTVEMFRPFAGKNEIVLNGNLADVKEQREVAEAILGSRDRYVSLRGVAGAGKTTVLPEIHSGLLAGGWRPLYLAPTATARDVLREGGFKADTLQQHLAELKNDELRLPASTVLIVDESGLTSNKLGLALMKSVERDQARVIFVGDVKQHTSVEAGDFLRILEENAPIQQFTLGNIQRQKLAEYKNAMQAAAKGNSREAVEQLDRLGWVKEGKGKYIGNAATELLNMRAEHGAKNVLAVAPTHEEGRALTTVVRRGLFERGELTGEKLKVVFDDLDWTAQQRKNIENYRVGLEVSNATAKIGPLKQNQIATVVGVDREKRTVKLKTTSGDLIDFRINRNTVENLQVGERRDLPVAIGDALLVTANSKKARITNGDILTVKEILEDGAIRTAEGKIVPPEFVHISHGYVVTSHRSQGKTVDHVVVAADTLSPKGAYVALSRGRKSAVLHTPEKENLLKKLPTVNQGRLAASDLQAVPRPPTEAHKAHEVRKAFWQRVVDRAGRAAKSTKRHIRRAGTYISRYSKSQNQRANKHDTNTTKTL